MQIIEVGVLALRRHWRPLVAGTALFASVPLLLSDLAQLRLGDAIGAAVTLDANDVPLPIPPDRMSDVLAASVPVVGAELLASALLILASLLASVYVAHDYHGTPTTFGAALSRVLHRAPVALVVWLLSTVITLGVLAATALLAALAYLALPPAAGAVGGPGAFIALVVLVAGAVCFVAASVRLLVAPVVAVLEEGGPLHALRRSWHLTSDNAWRSFGLLVLVSVTISVLVAVIGQFVALTTEALLTGGSIEAIVNVAFGLVLGLATAPIVPVMETVLYFDLRVRRDGLALELPGASAAEDAIR